MSSFEKAGDGRCLSTRLVDGAREPVIFDDWKNEKKCDEAPEPTELDPIEKERDGEGSVDGDVDLDVVGDADDGDDGEFDRDDMRMRNDFLFRLGGWPMVEGSGAGLWVATMLILSGKSRLSFTKHGP